MSANKQQASHVLRRKPSIVVDSQERNQLLQPSVSFLVTTQNLNSHISIHPTTNDLPTSKKYINQIQQLYYQIHSTINAMDSKVQHVIKKHETEFLFAYRNHIKKIKKELSQIKYKSQEQQKMFSSNDRIQYLEQQLAIFREETMKVYNKLDQKNLELDILKIKVKELQRQASHANDELKEYYKKTIVAEMNKVKLQEKVTQLESELQKKNAEIKRLTQRISGKVELNNSSIRHQSIQGSKIFNQDQIKRTQTSRQSPIQKSIKSHIKSLNSSINATTANFYNLALPRKSRVYDSDLKDWFLECIKTVKRQIAQRNSNQKALDLNNITSIEEFMMIDKLRLFEIFLHNEKLLTYMYERIFPNNLTTLRDRLSDSKHILLPKTTGRQPTVLTERQDKVVSEFNEALISDRYRTHTRLNSLPKVIGRNSQQKQKMKEKNQRKGKIFMRDGKLNISMA